MPSPRNKIKIGSYVELKEGFDQTDMYRLVESGATGWVRETKIDDGFAMVFIEWDENNPNYAGEKDKWAYESHFTVLADEDSIMESYIHSVKEASDASLAAESFITIAIVRRKHPVTGDDYFKPIIISNDLNDGAACVLEAQIVYAASQLFNDYIQDTLNILKEDEDEPRR